MPAALTALPCSCGARVKVLQSYGGAGSNSMTFYRVTCRKCGRDEDDLGRDGTLRSAIRMWNRLLKKEAL